MGKAQNKRKKRWKTVCAHKYATIYFVFVCWQATLFGALALSLSLSLTAAATGQEPQEHAKHMESQNNLSVSRQSALSCQLVLVPAWAE